MGGMVKQQREWVVRRALLLATALVAVAVPNVYGQPAAAPAFQEATVTLKGTGNEMSMLSFTPDGVAARDVPIQLLLQEAFAVDDDRILGAPAWVKTTRCDLVAKVASQDAPLLARMTRDQRGQMLLPVLQDRFQLKFHQESKELPSYALVIAGGGPKMNAAGPSASPATSSGMPIARSGYLETQGIRMEVLVHLLAQQLDRSVIDKTGLTGTYQFKLLWSPGGGAASLSTALQEQLGLKLDPQTGPVEMIVVDHIALPSTN